MKMEKKIKKMIITIVLDQYGNTNNGTTATAMRFANALKEHGHEVRVITAWNYKEEKCYLVNEYKVPVFDKIIRSQGMVIGKPDDDVIRKAIRGSDVVHLMLPFPLQRRALQIAKEEKVAVTAAFHCQPENVSYTIHMGKIKFVNDFIYHLFYKWLYRDVKKVHCPSNMIANQLKEHGYQNEFHVISNGCLSSFKPKKVERPEIYKDKIVIVTVGRYSREKRHDLLIKAVGRSKYHDHIQLIFCGNGPLRSKFEAMQIGMTNPIELKFCKEEELINILNYADLYVHASDAEIEAISCIEAFSCGLVPIISDSKKSATNQFCLTEECKFKHGNSKDLSQKIDYFIEHPHRIKELSKMYTKYAEQFQLDHCVRQLEEVFAEAIEENKAQYEN